MQIMSHFVGIYSSHQKCDGIQYKCNIRTTYVVYKTANKKMQSKIPNKTPKISRSKILLNTKSKIS